MIELVIALVLGAIGWGALIYTVRSIKKTKVEGGQQASQKVFEALTAASTQIDALSKHVDGYVSSEALSHIERTIASVQSEISSESARLKDVEAKLSSAQKSVEENELKQQEIKAAKENEEELLIELREKYEEYSVSAIELEQKLAQSLKNLDKLMSEITLSQEHRTTLETFSNALTSAGSRLRDLLTEYQVVSDRLKMLEQQHRDLELEYTRLVEQQLGD